MSPDPKTATRRRRRPRAPGAEATADVSASKAREVVKGESDDAIEGEVVDDVEVGSDVSRELAISTPQPAVGFDPGTQALAMLSDEEFTTRLAMLKKGRERIATIQRELLVVDVDYGIIPGTDDRHTLFKAGAEKLCQFYGLVSRIEVTYNPGDNVTVPGVRYDATCFIHLGSTEGPIVATGYGTANSWEKRYLRAVLKCPRCEAPAIMRSKFNPGWYCNPKSGGCGANLADDAITEAPDPKGVVTTAHDLGNTLAKMAEKRAHVDATLRATATSGLFTQDVIEDENNDTQLDESTTVTKGGATVDADGVVTGRTADPGLQSADGDPAGMGDPIPADEIKGPIGESVEETMATDAAADRARQARELAAAGNATDPQTGQIAADAIVKDPDAPEFTPSGVEGVGRGGVTKGSNVPQLSEVKRLSKENGLGPSGLITFMSEHGALDKKIAEAMLQIPDKLGMATALSGRLDKLDGQQVGKLIHDMREAFGGATA